MLIEPFDNAVPTCKPRLYGTLPLTLKSLRDSSSLDLLLELKTQFLIHTMAAGAFQGNVENTNCHTYLL
jgi:hypothetical protein